MTSQALKKKGEEEKKQKKTKKKKQRKTRNVTSVTLYCWQCHYFVAREMKTHVRSKYTTSGYQTGRPDNFRLSDRAAR